MTKPLKTGLWTLLAGILTVVGAVAQGSGPCGTPLGAAMLFSGMLAAVVGLLLTVVGLFFELKGHRTPAPSDPPVPR